MKLHRSCAHCLMMGEIQLLPAASCSGGVGDSNRDNPKPFLSTLPTSQSSLTMHTLTKRGEILDGVVSIDENGGMVVRGYFCPKKIFGILICHFYVFVTLSI